MFSSFETKNNFWDFLVKIDAVLPIELTRFWRLMAAMFVYWFVSNFVSVFSKVCHFFSSRFTLVQRLEIVQYYYANSRSPKNSQIHVNRKISFSDESHFWLNGFVNKQNCRYWGESNCRVVQGNAIVVWRHHQALLLLKLGRKCRYHQQRAL